MTDIEKADAEKFYLDEVGMHIKELQADSFKLQVNCS
jgi:hypothetical protein